MSDEDVSLDALADTSMEIPPDQVPNVQSEEDDDDDYDPSNIAPDASEPIASIAQDTNEAPNVEETIDEQDASTLAPPQQPPSRSVSRTSNVSAQAAQKPVTIGGFVTEDSDEEADATQVPQITQTNGAIALESVKSPSQAPTGSIPHSPVPVSVQDLGLAPAAQNVSSASLSVPVPVNGASTPTPAPSFILPSADGAVESKVGEAASALSSQSQVASAAVPKTRLPNDLIGIFEDRIAEDPKGDVDAWLGLIAHLRSKGKYDEVRKVYGRFFEVFPTAADQWVAYARMELQLDDLPRLEAIFNLSLLKVQSIDLWNIYIDHVRRRNDIVTDASGQGRQVVSQAYEFVINQVGQDKDSGQLWQDYIAFIKSGPGVAGGNGWQDAQKMDLLRKAYQRAVCVPMSAVSVLWKEYDTFEMGLNKMTGRKFLQEKSPSYMTARSSYTALQNIAANIRRGIVPRLPPHVGCDGEEDFNGQVDAWQKWIAWEKEDPLVLKDEDAKALQQRILFVYRQATMALRFYPKIWFEAAQWCFDNALDSDGNSFLDQGTEANPESCLLAFRKADQIEQTMPAEEGEDSMVKRGQAVRAPYDNLLNTLYKHHDKTAAQEKTDVARIEERYAAMSPDSREGSQEAAGDDLAENEGGPAVPLTKKARKDKEIEDRKAESEAQLYLIKKTISFSWIGLMRAMRRIQGKGKPGDKVGGMRGVFKDARTRGRLLADCHAATALLEHNCYRDQAASRIFNLGMKLFPEDENFALEHVKFLISTGDSTNARAVFETTVSKITAKPQNVHKAKILFAFFYDWESKYGELSQAIKIEKRIADLYPEDPALALFSQRFGAATIGPPPFDPCAVQLILSPTQTKLKSAIVPQAVPSIETYDAPAPISSAYVQSPKRGLEDSDAELPARKLLRGESPLKGAAGRRQQQRQAREGLLQQQQHQQQQQQQNSVTGPRPLPAAVQSLLAVIPPARAWDQTRFEPSKMVDLIRQVDLTKARLPQYGSYGYGR
ncbi:hypothetical protein K461DRAFT_253579 [Myriangium duriaei CBS 260.36]|uniref:mRNA 3'-end-processing protein RNA14 n=1 Tax=Myriangium duriaei CBS 260.36 TaxID=1168546 RepID=A0A9P4J658_9PEZI|nr:hypothetical protein K461DRAFT_253579 [Myriangium duriaei CBS 260.36]